MIDTHRPDDVVNIIRQTQEVMDILLPDLSLYVTVQAGSDGIYLMFTKYPNSGLDYIWHVETSIEKAVPDSVATLKQIVRQYDKW